MKFLFLSLISITSLIFSGLATAGENSIFLDGNQAQSLYSALPVEADQTTSEKSVSSVLCIWTSAKMTDWENYKCKVNGYDFDDNDAAKILYDALPVEREKTLGNMRLTKYAKTSGEIVCLFQSGSYTCDIQLN